MPDQPLDAAVAAYIAGFTPRLMTPTAWELAGAPVRQMATRAQPGSVAQARLYMSQLVQLLRDPQVWDPAAGAPVLEELLTVPVINAHLARVAGTGLAPRTMEARRDALMVFTRLLGHAAPKQRLGGGCAVRVDPFVRRGVELELPVAHVIAARATLPGHPRPQSDALRTVWRDLLASLQDAGFERAEGNAPVFQGGTLRAAAHRMLLDLPQPSTNGDTADNKHSAPLATTEQQALPQATSNTPPKAPSKASGAPAGRPLSRRAALAHAREAHARAEAAEAYLAAPTWHLPDGTDLPEDVRDAIAAFEPNLKTRQAWAVNRDLGMRLAYATTPTNRKVARSNCSYIALFLHWHITRPSRLSSADPTVPLRVEDLFATGTIEGFIAACPWSDRSKVSARSLLRRIERHLNPGQAPATLTHHRHPEPYTPAECARFVRLASHQPTRALTRDMAFIIGLGLGAGLDARDLRELRARDLTDSRSGAQTHLQVTVPDPTTPSGRLGRTVPVRRGYEPLVRRALALHAETGKSPDDLVVGRVTDRHNFVGVVSHRAKSADPDATVEVRAARLRNTRGWSPPCVLPSRSPTFSTPLG